MRTPSWLAVLRDAALIRTLVARSNRGESTGGFVLFAPQQGCGSSYVKSPKTWRLGPSSDIVWSNCNSHIIGAHVGVPPHSRKVATMIFTRRMEAEKVSNTTTKRQPRRAFLGERFDAGEAAGVARADHAAGDFRSGQDGRFGSGTFLHL